MTSRSLPGALVSAALCLSLALPPLAARTTDRPLRIGGSERVRVDLVLIDVVVRDRKDRPVSGLSKDDFELLVDRLPVPPESMETFEEICAPQEPAGPPSPKAPDPVALSPASPAIAGPAAAAGPARHIVLYFDFSHMTLSGRRQALDAARDYIGVGMTPGDRVMILAFKKDLRLVQEFTSSTSLLAGRLDELIADSATLDSDVLEESQNMHDVARRGCDATGVTCTARRALAHSYAVQEEMRTRRTVGALKQLMPALAGLRGRKALIVFSDVLREEPGIQYVALALSTPEAEGITIKSELLELTREANAAGVSIYTVHASGLDDRILEGFRDARPENVTISSSNNSVASDSAGSSQTEMYAAARTALDSALSLQTMLATETGGRALQRTNDLARIIGTAQQDLSCYYLLGYRHSMLGDDSRHSLIVRLRPDGPAGAPRGLTVRHRPYFIDRSPQDVQDRQLRSALEVPDLYRNLPVLSEAFALAPDASGRDILIKATVPLESLSLLPAGDSWLEGRVVVRGDVSLKGDPVCEFEHELPLRVARSAGGATRLIFETGCVLKPGSYELALAVLDPATGDIGARRSPLVVPAAVGGGLPFVSDIHLWTREAGAVLISAGADRIGLKDGATTGGFVPRAERRMRSDQDALLSFLLCPPAGSDPSADRPIRIIRRLTGEGDLAVAEFKDLVLAEPPDPDTGCYQILNSIPARTLGSGIYTFTLQARGLPLGAPLTRQAALSVE